MTAGTSTKDPKPSHNRPGVAIILLWPKKDLLRFDYHFQSSRFPARVFQGDIEISDALTS